MIKKIAYTAQIFITDARLIVYIAYKRFSEIKVRYAVNLRHQYLLLTLGLTQEYANFFFIE